MFDAKGSAEKIKKGTTAEIKLPVSGADVTIRKIGLNDFVVCGVELPTGETAKAGRVDPDQRRRSVEMYFTRGVVSPRVIVEDGKEVGEDEVHVNDFDVVDATFIISEINKLSGYAGAESEAVSSFPKEEQEQREDD